MKVLTLELANGCEAVACPFPDDWWLGEQKVLCGCGLRVSGVFPFIKRGRLWIRARHGGGVGFCDFEAVSDEMREQRSRRVLHPALRSR